MFALGLRSLRKIFACGPAIIRPRSSGSLRLRLIWHHRLVIALLHISLRLLADLLALTAMAFRRRRATAAEILVLRRQLALYKERGAKPRRIDAARPGESSPEISCNVSVRQVLPCYRTLHTLEEKLKRASA